MVIVMYMYFNKKQFEFLVSNMIRKLLIIYWLLKNVFSVDITNLCLIVFSLFFYRRVRLVSSLYNLLFKSMFFLYTVFILKRKMVEHVLQNMQSLYFSGRKMYASFIIQNYSYHQILNWGIFDISFLFFFCVTCRLNYQFFKILG